MNLAISVSIFSAADIRVAAERTVSTSRDPRRASTSAISLPNPRDPPVTTAIDPDRSPLNRVRFTRKQIHDRESIRLLRPQPILRTFGLGR